MLVRLMHVDAVIRVDIATRFHTLSAAAIKFYGLQAVDAILESLWLVK